MNEINLALALWWLILEYVIIEFRTYIIVFVLVVSLGHFISRNDRKGKNL